MEKFQHHAVIDHREQRSPESLGFCRVEVYRCEHHLAKEKEDHLLEIVDWERPKYENGGQRVDPHRLTPPPCYRLEECQTY